MYGVRWRVRDITGLILESGHGLVHNCRNDYHQLALCNSNCIYKAIAKMTRESKGQAYSYIAFGKRNTCIM